MAAKTFSQPLHNASARPALVKEGFECHHFYRLVFFVNYNWEFAFISLHL